jgi:hypothetical protein
LNGIFVSYARKDSRLVEELLDLLQPHLKASRRHEYLDWEDHRLLAGQQWHDRIQSEIAASRLGLLCISPEFLASNYIRENEVPALLQRPGIIPVGLKPVDLLLHDWHSLDQYQLFRLRTPRGEVQWFSQLRGAGRDAFALELFRQIEGRLETMTS